MATFIQSQPYLATYQLDPYGSYKTYAKLALPYAKLLANQHVHEIKSDEDIYEDTKFASLTDTDHKDPIHPFGEIKTVNPKLPKPMFTKLAKPKKAKKSKKVKFSE